MNILRLCRQLASQDLHTHLTSAWTIKLAKIDPLPRSQKQRIFDNRHCDGAPHQRTLHVSGRITFPMTIPQVGHHLPERRQHVCHYVRICVFIDCHACCSVGYKDLAYSLLNIAAPHNLPDCRCDINKSFLWCCDPKLFHWQSPLSLCHALDIF